MCILEGFCIHGSIHTLHLTGRVIVARYGNIVLIQLCELPAVASDGHMTVLYIAVQGFCRIMSCRNGIDCELRSGVDISSDEYIRLSGLIGQLVCNDGRTVEFHTCSD